MCRSISGLRSCFLEHVLLEIPVNVVLQISFGEGDMVPFEREESLGGKLGFGKLDSHALAGIAVVAIALAILAGGNIARAAATTTFSLENESKSVIVAESTGSDSNESALCVHVAGCVNTPGVYYLASGSRIVDAIEAAGGFTDDASADALNLASSVSDGMKVFVASLQQDDQTNQGVNHLVEATMQGSSLVNINTASIAKLQELPGIGPSMAARIVAFRDQHGYFKSIEELMNVSGIGEKKLEALRDFVTV